MENNSAMARVNKLFVVAKCLADKGVEKDDDPVWIAETFSMLLELIENELDIAVAQIGKTADDRPAA